MVLVCIQWPLNTGSTVWPPVLTQDTSERPPSFRNLHWADRDLVCVWGGGLYCSSPSSSAQSFILASLPLVSIPEHSLINVPHSDLCLRVWSWGIQFASAFLPFQGASYFSVSDEGRWVPALLPRGQSFRSASRRALPSGDGQTTYLLCVILLDLELLVTAESSIYLGRHTQQSKMFMACEVYRNWDILGD